MTQQTPEPIRFAYWVPNVSGGLVISKIPQRTSWDADYNRELARIAERVGSPTFFLFSDDPAWTAANLRVPWPHCHVGHNPPSAAVQDLRTLGRMWLTSQKRRADGAGWRQLAGLDVTWRPSPMLLLSVEPQFERNRIGAQYVTTSTSLPYTPTFGARYLFADLDRTELSVPTRLNVTMSPRLTLQLFAQPLLSAGNYLKYKQLAAAGPPRSRAERSAWNRVSSSNGFSMKSQAPSFMASTVSGTSPCPVIMTMGSPCPAPRRRRSSSSPSMPGMRMSARMQPVAGLASRFSRSDPAS